MRSSTSVVFDQWEIDVLATAKLHLGVAYPGVHVRVQGKPNPDDPDHDARLVSLLVRDRAQGNYDNVVRALRAFNHLAAVLERESRLEHWLDLAERDTGERPTPSEDPTSLYAVLDMLAGIRETQLRETRAAVTLLREAASVVTPLKPLTNEHKDMQALDN